MKMSCSFFAEKWFTCYVIIDFFFYTRRPFFSFFSQAPVIFYVRRPFPFSTISYILFLIYEELNTVSGFFQFFFFPSPTPKKQNKTKKEEREREREREWEREKEKEKGGNSNNNDAPHFCFAHISKLGTLLKCLREHLLSKDTTRRGCRHLERYLHKL